MSPADAVCSVHREFTASPRRLLAAVLASSPHRFRLVSARGAEICFVFRVLARDGIRTGEEVDRKSGVSGQSASVRVDLGGRRYSKRKNTTIHHEPVVITSTDTR